MASGTFSQLVSKYNLPKEAVAPYTRAGLTTLYPPQQAALEKGALRGENILLSVPTAAGKTLIAELCMLRAFFTQGGRSLYIVPLKALANEKLQDFTQKFQPLGLKVGLATGDSATESRSLKKYDILIATSEKVDSLLRSRSEWLINALAVTVIDEIHFLNDGSRGPTLEILTARIRQLNPNMQTVALSATISNAEEMAAWLNAQLVWSDWRPIPLKEGVFQNNTIYFHNALNREILETQREELSNLVLDTLKGKGQALVFVNSRRSTQSSARLLCASVSRVLTPEEKSRLQKLARDIVGSSGESTKVCRQLAEVVTHGCAFHHAGLKARQRELVEKHYKENLLKVICSTPTLAAGVNLPARRVILRDYKRFEAGLGAARIPVSEYKQCAGRAGRPQYDPYGEAVLMAKTDGERKALTDRYIKSDPEPILSQLGQEAALRIHILASIAGGYVHDVNDALDFLSQTLLAKQKHAPNLLTALGHIFEFLKEEGFIEKNGLRVLATEFGQVTSRLYIDPASAIILRDGLLRQRKRPAFVPAAFLHLITCCPDSPLLKISNKEMDRLETFAQVHEQEWLTTAADCPPLENILLWYSTIKTTMLLVDWIEEERDETLCDRFNIGPGDIYRHTEAIRWLLHAAQVFAALFHAEKITVPLQHLETRVRYGIKDELRSLVQLRGIGRVRARNLFDHGIRSLTDVAGQSVDALAPLPHIGRTLARDIIKQVSALRTTGTAEALQNTATKKSLQQELADYTSERIRKMQKPSDRH